jgi:regulation of enolase protein 1 (concanavalin A-like superfamily)
VLEVLTAQNTDFWSKTHYGFVADNGHFLHATVTSAKIRMETRVRLHAKHQYDQASAATTHTLTHPAMRAERSAPRPRVLA